MNKVNERYLVRGKRLNLDNEWITGYYVGPIDICDTNLICNIKGDVIRVDPATVGQCTGLRDSNGVLVFEGDIVADYDNGIDSGGQYIVFWDNEELILKVKFIVSDEVCTLRDVCISSDGTIIGNIHDNPELLGGIPNAEP